MRWIFLDHDRSALDHKALGELVSVARVISRRVAALEAVLMAEAEAAAPRDEAPSTTWTLDDPSATRAEIMKAVHTGRDLAESDAVRRAALAGEVPVGRARLLAKAVRHLPAELTGDQRTAAEADLVAHAERLTERTLHQAVADTVGRVAPALLPSDEDEQQRLDAQTRRAHARRSLRLLPDGDGSILLQGSLPAVTAAPLVSMIDALVAAGRRERRSSRDRLDPLAPEVTPEQHRADAFAALIAACQTGARAEGVWSAGSGGREGPGGAAPAGRIPQVAGERPRVVVTMQESELRARAEQAGVLADGTAISAGALRRLCCDAELLPVVLGSESRVLDVGRSHRLVTPELRRALSLRDAGCVFPGCGTPDGRCEAHHVIPWWAGGATSLENLVLLCPHHHALIEPARFFGDSGDRWEVRFDESGQPLVIPPARVDARRTPINPRAA